MVPRSNTYLCVSSLPPVGRVCVYSTHNFFLTLIESPLFHLSLSSFVYLICVTSITSESTEQANTWKVYEWIWFTSALYRLITSGLTFIVLHRWFLVSKVRVVLQILGLKWNNFCGKEDRVERLRKLESHEKPTMTTRRLVVRRLIWRRISWNLQICL